MSRGCACRRVPGAHPRTPRAVRVATVVCRCRCHGAVPLAPIRPRVAHPFASVELPPEVDRLLRAHRWALYTTDTERTD